MNVSLIIKALEAELDGYIRRGRTDRADQVRQELTRLGHSATQVAEVVHTETVNAPKDATTHDEKPVETLVKPKATRTPKPGKKA